MTLTLEDIESHILSALQRNTDAVVAADLQAARIGLQAIMAKRIEQPAAAPADERAAFVPYYEGVEICQKCKATRATSANETGADGAVPIALLVKYCNNPDRNNRGSLFHFHPSVIEDAHPVTVDSIKALYEGPMPSLDGYRDQFGGVNPDWRPEPVAAQPSAEVTDADLTALLPGAYYMDPPDGGDVSMLEQLRRMANDAARYRWWVQFVFRAGNDGYPTCTYLADVEDAADIDAAIDAARSGDKQ